ncbi:MAG: NAD(P)/FAD-dependent oxidoreductase, partial [Planctomycetota bacterium]
MRNKDAKARRCIIIGAGPAGLTAAYELSKLGIPAAVLEKDSVVGGIARTASHNGYRFDIGGHRFFTKVAAVEDLWFQILGSDFLTRPRLSRIYYNGTFFDYPLKPLNAFLSLGPAETVRIALSFLRVQLFPLKAERTFEEWVTQRFGRRLYEIFFKTYTEKVWGMPCSEISADWAAQRIKNLDLVSALKHALLGSRASREVVTTLIDRFHYPRLGPGMMWERCQKLLSERGVPTCTDACVIRLRHRDGQVESATVRDSSGNEREESGSDFISSMPLRELVRAFDPPAPPDVLAAAARLRHRDFLTVVLIVNQPDLFPDQWIYIHSPEVRLGRVQNFKNWSPDMVPDPSTSALGLEYFLQASDALWNLPDEELIAMGRREAAQVGLIDEADAIDGCVVRMPNAYPLYDEDYADALASVRSYLDKFANLDSVGRNGQHRYNNQDHSMLTAMYAARNVVEGSYDPWDVNVDEDYHEEAGRLKWTGGDRAVPERVPVESAEGLIRAIFARYDPVALGGAVGAVLGLGIFFATAILLLRGDEPVGPTLSLAGNYLLGFRVTWGGAFLGLAEAGVGGFGFG